MTFDRCVECIVVGAVLVSGALLFWVARAKAPDPEPIRFLTPETLGARVRHALDTEGYYHAAYSEGEVHVYANAAGWRVHCGGQKRQADSRAQASEMVTEWYAEATGKVGPNRSKVRRLYHPSERV